MNTTNAFQLLSKNFGRFVLVAMLFSIVGCASSSRKPLDMDELVKFQADCSIKDSQFEFLKNALPTRGEIKSASVQRQYFRRWDNDDEDTEYMSNGAYKFWVNRSIGKIYKKCEK
jgi:hypothetical protein